MLKLLGSTSSPFVRKIRMMMLEKGIPFELVHTATSDPANGLMDVNPLGKVPALLTEDERAVYDSRVIVEYLEVLHPEPPLLPPPGMERVSVRRWEALGDGICDATLLIRFESTRENDLQRSPKWIAKQMSKIEHAIPALAAEIGNNEYCFGGRLTVADLSVMSALGYLDIRLPAVNWREFAELARYHDRMSKRKSVMETAPPADKK